MYNNIVLPKVILSIFLLLYNVIIFNQPEFKHKKHSALPNDKNCFEIDHDIKLNILNNEHNMQ